MKTCEEMVTSLLARRQRYAAMQKKKRQTLRRGAICLCCLSLAALVGFGVHRIGSSRTRTPGQTAADAVYPGIPDTLDESGGESAAPSPADRIILHPIHGLTADRAVVGLSEGDFVPMSRAEMIDYYGVNYVPEVPADLAPWEDERSGVYRRDGGTGEIYWDADILNYSNPDFTRNVHLEVDKGGPVRQDCLFDGTEEASVIHGAAVLMGVTDGGCYYAEFLYQGVGFLMSADGLTQDEFVAIIASVLDGTGGAAD